MSGRLIYVVGPSGAGKDSLLAWAKDNMPSDANVHFVRRTVTRPVTANGEPHESVNDAMFAQLLEAKAFALHWRANGLSYGIRQSELATLESSGTVVLNGSREYALIASEKFPSLVIVHVLASGPVLRERLMRRGRESAAEIEARVERASTWSLPQALHDKTHEIRNDGVLEDAGARLVSKVLQR